MISKKINNEYLAILISFSLTTLIYLNTDLLDYYHSNFPKPWDHHKYLYMAISQLDFHIAPFCWRILVPFLASILPFELSVNFQFISFISLIFTGYFVFKIGEKIFNDSTLAFAMLISFYSLSFSTKFVIHDFWLPDAFANMLIAAGIYYIIIKKDQFFLIVMIIGAITKESVLFTLPLYYTLRTKKFFDKRLLKQTILISLIPLLVLLFVRIIILPLNSSEEYVSSLPEQLKLVHFDSSDYNLDYLINEFAPKRISEFSFETLHRITIYTFTIHFLLSFLNFRMLKVYGSRFSIFLLLSYLQIFFAINDDRLVAIAFVPFSVLSIAGLAKFFGPLPFRNYSILILSIIFFLMVLFSGIYYGNWLIIREVFLVVFAYGLLKLVKWLGKLRV